MNLRLVTSRAEVVRPPGVKPEKVASLLDAGYRRILVKEAAGGPGIERPEILLAGQGGNTLMLVEYEAIPPTLSELRAKLGRDRVGGWGDGTRVEVSNYERVGLYARFAPPDTFSLILMAPYRSQSSRSARIVNARFGERAAVVQISHDDQRAFDLPDAEMTREGDGTLSTALGNPTAAPPLAVAS